MHDMEYTQGGILVPRRPDKPEFREVATTADGRDITRGFVDALPLLPPMDSVLARHGGDYSAYEDMLRDDQVSACFNQLKLAVVSKEWEVLPGGKSRKDVAAADHLREQLDELNFDGATERMVYGAFYGYGVAENMFARDGRHVMLPEIKVRKQRRFGFSPKGALKLRTMTNPLGELVHPRKFWHFAYGGDSSDEPYGLGMANPLYWPVLFKRNGIRFWMTFLDKFGIPTAVGKFPNGATPPEKQKLLSAVRAIQRDTGLIIPDGMAVDLLEAARSGTADYSALCDRMDNAIAKVILGQTATTQGTPGRLGDDDTQKDMFNNQVKAIADLLCQSFNRGTVRWLAEWNYPGCKPPKVWRQTQEPEDLKSRAERDKIIVDMGFKPTLQSINDTYPGEWEEAKKPAVPQNGEQDAAFAEGSDQESDLALTELLAQASDPIIEGWVQQLQQLVERGSSLPKIRNDVASLVKHLQTDTLSKVLQQALATAVLGGMADVEDTAFKDVATPAFAEVRGGFHSFRQAVEHFQQKVPMATRAWDDIQTGQHARAFVVAGAARDDLLKDLFEAVDAAISQGETLEDFRARFRPLMERQGWLRRTGFDTEGGFAWRTRTIYQTNVRTAYMAGRYQQLQSYPYWRYKHNSVENPREQHQRWDGLILARNDPWWMIHWPPNGWGCRCSVFGVSEARMRMEGWSVGQAPARVPGDPPAEWAYNVGEADIGRRISDAEMQIWRDQKAGAWEQLTPGDASSFDRPRKLPRDPLPVPIPSVAVPADHASMVRLITESLGSRERLFKLPIGPGLTQPALAHAERLADHIDPARASYVPLLPHVMAAPYEVWQSFERHRGTGRVVLRTRYVRAFDMPDKSAVLVVVEAIEGEMVSWTLVPGRPSYIEKQRHGQLLYGRET